VLVTGPDIDVPRLDAVVRRDLPGATVTLRATDQAALSRAPLPHDEAAAIVAAEIAAAGLTLLVLLIMIAGAARARRSTVARLRVMGVTGRQARWAELAETLPLVVATAVGGIACAWALGPLIGPALNLSALTGGATAPVGARWAPLGAAAAGLPRSARIALLAGITGLTAASEKVSFTKVIERTQALRWLDMLGRRPPEQVPEILIPAQRGDPAKFSGAATTLRSAENTDLSPPEE